MPMVSLASQRSLCVAHEMVQQQPGPGDEELTVCARLQAIQPFPL